MALRIPCTRLAISRLLLLLSLLALVEHAATHPTPSPATPAGKAGKKGQEIASSGFGTNVGCGFIGNPDVYGLGIRIGLYSQWLSTLISNWLHSQNVTRMRDINTSFQLAMLIALLSLTQTSPTPHAIEIYLIIVQIVGSACTISSHATHKSQWAETSWGGITRFFIYWAVAVYSTYFWFFGVEKLAPLEPGCKAYGFIFYKAELLGWFRTVHKAVSGLAAAVFTVLFGFLIYKHGATFLDRSAVGAYKRRKHQKLDAGPQDGAEKLLDDLTNPNAAPMGQAVSRLSPAVCCIVLLTAIAAIETLIVWNGIVDVNTLWSTGQLLPFVTGVGGLVRVLYLMWAQPDLRVHVVHTERNRPGVRQGGYGGQAYGMRQPQRRL